MNNSYQEKIFFRYLIDTKDFINYVKPEFFESKELQKLYKICLEFILKFNQSPSIEQIFELVKSKKIDIDYETLKIFLDIDINNYDEDWLKETFEAWVEYKNLDVSVKSLIEYLKSTKINTENVKDVVLTAKNIILEGNNIDFNFDEGLDFFNPESHIQPVEDFFSTGYPYMDLCGGFATKSLIVLMAPPKVGKSWWLANLCANSIRLGYNTALISLEMRDRKVIKRLGANLLNIEIKKYNDVSKNSEKIKKLLNDIRATNQLYYNNEMGHLWVKEYPTSSASVIDIENYLKKIENNKKIKFKIVIIDYLNIIKNYRNPNSENLYMKIKQISEDLRAMAVRNNWCVLSATQVNRSGFDSSDLTMNNISESSALMHTVDQLYAIIQDPYMHANNKYLLKLVANRDEGMKNSKKEFLVDYNFGRITENMNTDIILDNL